MNSLLFYRNKANNSGLVYNDVFSFNDDEWEHYHNFIQWVFPSDEPSMIIHYAPVLNHAKLMKIFTNDAQVIERYRSLFIKFIHHLGLIEKNGSIVPDPNKSHKTYQRVFKPNHNWQRITRALRSTRLLGQDDLATKLWLCLKIIAADISPVTWQYWENAMSFDIAKQGKK